MSKIIVECSYAPDVPSRLTVGKRYEAYPCSDWPHMFSLRDDQGIRSEWHKNRFIEVIPELPELDEPFLPEPDPLDPRVEPTTNGVSQMSHLSFSTVRSALSIMGIRLQTRFIWKDHVKETVFVVSFWSDPNKEVTCDDLEEALIEGAKMAHKAKDKAK